MTVEDATPATLLAYLKTLRAAGLTDLRRVDSLPEFDDTADASSDAEAASPDPPREAVASDAAATVEISPEPIPSREESAPIAEPGRASTSESARDVIAAVDDPWPTPLTRDDRVQELERLASEVEGCVRCAELAKTRKQTVFGVGNPTPRLVLLGEAPGADEDRLGEPFVGRAGQLLDKMIAACTLRREEVYILNVLKCRPPGNRNPLPAEASACRPFLDRQLEILQPEFILCLGAVAAKNLLGVELSVGRMRGKLFPFRGAQVVVTYHPSYLLRTETAKRDAWDDLKFLMREMGIELPAKRADD